MTIHDPQQSQDVTFQALIRRQDGGAWDKLINTEEPHIHRKLTAIFGRRNGEAIDTAVRETFSEAFVHIQGWDPKKWSLRNWILAIAKRRYYEARDNGPSISELYDNIPEAPPGDSEDSVETDDSAARLARQRQRSCLDDLSEEDRKILEMSGERGKRNDWTSLAASVFKRSKGALRIKRHRIIKYLRELYRKRFGDS